MFLSHKLFETLKGKSSIAQHKYVQIEKRFGCFKEVSESLFTNNTMLNFFN